MKKLERMNSELFSELKAGKMNELSKVFGGVNTDTNPMAPKEQRDTFLTSSALKGNDEIKKDTTSWCDDSCMDDGYIIDETAVVLFSGWATEII